MHHRTPEEPARRPDPTPALGRRPPASWVMGRSARWHDPDLLAELRMHELARQRQDVAVLTAGAGCLPAAGAMALGVVVRLFRRRPRR